MQSFLQATQSSVRDVIDKQVADDTREYTLGVDSGGNRYIHFPQFCGDMLRVYKLSKSYGKNKTQPKVTNLYVFFYCVHF